MVKPLMRCGKQILENITRMPCQCMGCFAFLPMSERKTIRNMDGLRLNVLEPESYKKWDQTTTLAILAVSIRVQFTPKMRRQQQTPEVPSCLSCSGEGSSQFEDDLSLPATDKKLILIDTHICVIVHTKVDVERLHDGNTKVTFNGPLIESRFPIEESEKNNFKITTL